MSGITGERGGRKRRARRKTSAEPPSDSELTASPYGCDRLARPPRGPNVLERIVRASSEGRGKLALQLTLFYLDNPRLIGSDELDPLTLVRLIQDYVIPLVAKSPEDGESIRRRLHDCLPQATKNLA